MDKQVISRSIWLVEVGEGDGRRTVRRCFDGSKKVEEEAGNNEASRKLFNKLQNALYRARQLRLHSDDAYQ